MFGFGLIVVGYHDTFPTLDGHFQPWFFKDSANAPVLAIALGAALIAWEAKS